MLGKPVQLWNSWMILQGRAVRFLYLLLSLLRFFILIGFKIRACLAIWDFSHAISPSLYFSLKGRMEEKERTAAPEYVRSGARVPRQRMAGERAAEGGGSGLRMPDRAVVVKLQLREEALLGPSEALLLVLLEHPWLGSVGPGLCLLLLPVVVILL